MRPPDQRNILISAASNLLSSDFFIAQHSEPYNIAVSLPLYKIYPSTLDGNELRAISYFLCLMEADDQSVCMAAGEAIALICEVGCLEKFSSNIRMKRERIYRAKITRHKNCKKLYPIMPRDLRVIRHFRVQLQKL
ncbi:hypothetical protein OROHE_024466 [Orobanche hederae]